MNLMCSFCRKSSDLGKVACLEGLEFNDRQGYLTLVTDVISEILPEVTDTTATCDECLQIIYNFYQLKRDISQGFYKYGDPVEEDSGVIKNEFGVFTVTSLNCENIEMSAPLSSNFDKLEYKTEQIKDECKAELAIEIEQAANCEDNFSNQNGSSIANKKNKADSALTSYTIDSDDENNDFGSDDLKCSVCSKEFNYIKSNRLHYICEHSKNSESIKAWILQEIRKTETCRICRKRYNSSQAFRYHLLTHISNGEIKVKDIISGLKKSRTAPHFLQVHDERRNSAEKSENSQGFWFERKLQECSESTAITGKWTCCVCSKVMRTYESLRCHLQLHSQQGGETLAARSDYIYDSDVTPVKICKKDVTTKDVTRQQFEAEETKQVENTRDHQMETEELVVVKHEKEDEILIEVEVPDSHGSSSAQSHDNAGEKSSFFAVGFGKSPNVIETNLRKSKKKQNLKDTVKQTEIEITSNEKGLSMKYSNVCVKDRKFITAQCSASRLGASHYQCIDCSHSFSSYNGVYQHFTRTHMEKETRSSWIDEQIEEILENSKTSKKWPCCVCAMTADSSAILRKHLHMHLTKGEVDYLKVSSNS